VSNGVLLPLLIFSQHQLQGKFDIKKVGYLKKNLLKGLSFCHFLSRRASGDARLEPLLTFGRRCECSTSVQGSWKLMWVSPTVVLAEFATASYAVLLCCTVRMHGRQAATSRVENLVLLAKVCPCTVLPLRASM